MTWSILARDVSGAFGVAIASRFFAVGALCPHARSGVGALATQALVNPLYAAPALDLLAKRMSPDEIVQVLIGGDAGRDHRQLHVIDAQGRTAAYTGRRVHRLVRSSCGRALFHHGQHACGTASAFRNGGRVLANRRSAVQPAGRRPARCARSAARVAADL